jgi:uncharacterized protein YndB with AHSA1/START domain
MAPKPYRLKTKEMDFREGGRWLYTMVAPGVALEDVKRYSLVEYIKIQPKSSFSTNG